MSAIAEENHGTDFGLENVTTLIGSLIIMQYVLIGLELHTSMLDAHRDIQSNYNYQLIPLVL